MPFQKQMKNRCRITNSQDDSRKMKRALRSLERQYKKEGRAAIEKTCINDPVKFIYAIAAVVAEDE